MIQRIQSVYLTLITLLTVFLLKGNFLSFIDGSGSYIHLAFLGLVRDSGIDCNNMIEKLFFFSSFLILIPALSLIAIFLFKNRKVQIWFTLSLIFLISGFILISFYYSYVIISEYNASFIPGLRMIIPGLQFVFAILAYRGIRKDDRLVKSYDRLR